MINLENFFTAKTKLFCFKEFDQTFTVYQLNRNNPLTIGFFFCVCAEPTSRNKNTFVSSSHNRISKIANLCATD